jgi:DNA-binding XRE family transcriptional regulator
MQPTTEQLRQQWGAAVAQHRKDRKLSQRGLARLAGIGQDTVSAIEKGEHGGSDLTRIALARAFGVEVHELFAYPPIVEAAAS